MKKILAVILAILTMFIFTACSSGSDDPNTPPTEPEQETAICYEFKYYLAQYNCDAKYYWGDSYRGIVFTEKYAKFILKKDKTADVWWKNVKYTGRWRYVENETKIVFDDEKQSVAIKDKWISSSYGGWYEYFIYDIGENYYMYENDYVYLTKDSNYKI